MRKQLSLAAVLAAVCLVGQMATAAPIHDAAAKGNLAAVKKLVTANPSVVNVKDKTGATPLHHAVAAHSKAVVEFLLANKANIEAKKSDGVRPLHVAAAVGQLDIVELLVAKRADVNAADASGRTPLSIARQKNNAKIIEFLAAHNAIDPTIPSPGATTPPAQPISTPQPPRPAAAKATDLVKLSNDLVQALQDGKYSLITDRLDTEMKSTMSADKLKALKDAMITQLGSFKRVTKSRQTTKDGYDVVFVTCEFANASVDVQFTYNDNQQIAGFFVVPPDK